MDNDDVLQRGMSQRMNDKFDKYWGNWHEPDPRKKWEGKREHKLDDFYFSNT